MKLHPKTRNHADRATRSSPPVTRVYLTLGRFDNERGRHYNAHLGSADGEQIVTDALDVEYAACRALKARGVTGRMETWWPGSLTAASVVRDIEKGAALTMREDATRALSVIKYRPLPKERVKLRKSGKRQRLPSHLEDHVVTHCGRLA
jgi:hypothetical protein